MNIIFFGTPELAKNFLAPLIQDEEISVCAVVTQPPKPVGPKKVITSSPVQQLAEAHNVPVLSPTNLKELSFEEQLKGYNPDVFVIVAYGKILPKAILDIPAKGNINVHPSLLPKYRGPSPVQSAIASGEKVSGVSIMLIDEEMDHGPLLHQVEVPVAENETPETFYAKTATTTAPALPQVIKQYVNGELSPKEQEHDMATFCKLLKRSDGQIDWTTSAPSIESKIRGFTPWPGTFTYWNGKMLKIHKASLTLNKVPLSPGEVSIEEDNLYVGTGTDPLEIHELQLEGKKRMQAQEFLKGYRHIEKHRLG